MEGLSHPTVPALWVCKVLAMVACRPLWTFGERVANFPPTHLFAFSLCAGSGDLRTTACTHLVWGVVVGGRFGLAADAKSY